MNTLKTNRSCSTGFSLIEVLVVMAIMAILLAIIVPVIKRARQHARKAVCANNIRQIGVTIATYASEYKLRLPGPYYDTGDEQTNDDLSALYPNYSDSLDIFVCPETMNIVADSTDLEHSAVSKTGRGISYEYVNGIARRWGKINPGEIRPSPLAFDNDNTGDTFNIDGDDNHIGLNGGHILNIDGSVEWIRADEWNDVVYSTPPAPSS